MAVTVDELFTKDLNDLMKVAEELLDTKDPGTAEFVTKQIMDLQEFLQRNNLRITKLRDGGVEDPVGETLDHLKLWRDMKDNEWKSVFWFFIKETREPVQLVLERLLTVLKKAYETTGDNMLDSRAQIAYQVIQPGAAFEKTRERQRAWEAFGTKEEELNGFSAQCQFKAMPFCIDSIKKNIRDAILKKDKNLCTVPNASDAFNKAIDDYFLKCIEFSWAVAFEEKPPILLVTDPHKECPKLLNNFEGLDKLHKLCTVEWPALVQGDIIICPWVLKERNQLRPTAPPYTKDELLNVSAHKTEHGRTVESQSRAEMTSPILQGRSLPKSQETGKGRPLPQSPETGKGRPLPPPPETEKASKSQKGTTQQHQKDAITAQNVNIMKQRKIHGKMKNNPNVNF